MRKPLTIMRVASAQLLWPLLLLGVVANVLPVRAYAVVSRSGPAPASKLPVVAVAAAAGRSGAVVRRQLHDEHGAGSHHANESACEGEEHAAVGSTAFAVNVVICIVLVLSAGVFSGLTIGLMAIDSTELMAIINADADPDDPNEIVNARKILPLVEKHHLLLVTLLLSNAAAMEALPIFLNKICPSELMSILISVTAVLFFGEVIPQALCSAYGLAIGAKTAPFVNCLMVLLYVVAKPIALVLDKLFGHSEHRYRKAEFKALFNLHLEEASASHASHGGSSHSSPKAGSAPGHEESLNQDEIKVMRAALDLSLKSAQTKGVLTPLEDVFMLDTDTVMDHATMTSILTSGRSRVPIYDGERDNIIGVIITKTLIMLDPAACTPVSRSGIQTSGILRVRGDTGLYALLDMFQIGTSHLAVVYQGEPSADGEGGAGDDGGGSLTGATQGGKVLGITTLEDILEELLNEEIYDETDAPDSADAGTSSGERVLRRDLWAKRVAPPHTTRDKLGRLLPAPGALPSTPGVLRESRARRLHRTAQAVVATNRMKVGVQSSTRLNPLAEGEVADADAPPRTASSSSTNKEGLGTNLL